MSITLGVIAGIGMQIYSASYNHKRQSKLMKQMQAMQQDFETKLQTEGMERAWDKLEELCKFQKQLEEDLHAGRVKNITDYYEKSMKDIVAYSKVLSNWPLWVLPFVMKDESLFDNEQQNNSQKVALHCLLSRSNDDDFNNAIHNELENRLNQYFNRYWSAISTHPVIFYNGAWKTAHAGGVIDNLRNQLNNLPTIVISPWIPEEDDEFHFEISIWGIPNIEKIYKFTPNDIKFHYKQKQKAYTKEDKTQILNELCPALEAFISYIADQYYWGYYQIPPMLPSLLSKSIISIGNDGLEEYKKGYLAMFDEYVVENNEINKLNILLNPADSVKLLESINTVISKEEVHSFLYDILLKTCELRGFNYRSLSINEIFEKENLPLETPFIQDFLNLYETLKPSNKKQIESGKICLKNHDYSQAESHFMEADNDMGYYWLGIMEYEGLGKKKSYKKALDYFRKSKMPHSIFMQALMCFRGEGVLQNFEVAEELLSSLISNSSQKTIMGTFDLLRFMGFNEKFMKKIRLTAESDNRKVDILLKVIKDNASAEEIDEVYSKDFHKLKSGAENEVIDVFINFIANGFGAISRLVTPLIKKITI